MTKIPSQFYIAALLLLLWWGPWSFISYLPDPFVLVGVITLQWVFVLLANRIVRDNWICPIILIEALCMLFNATLFAYPALLVEFHAQFMKAAFIIELLIITVSLRGEKIGGAFSSDSYRMARLRLCNHRFYSSGLYRRKEALS